MTRPRSRAWLLGVALLSLLASQAVWAISPTLFLIYGDGLQNPIIARPQDPSEFSLYQFLWWRAGTPYAPRTTWTPPAGLNGRPYLKVAIFWGLGPFEDYAALVRALGSPDVLKQMNPEDASQHGRLYLPTASEPAMIVLTSPNMTRPKGTPCEAHTPVDERAPCPVPVPTKPEDFIVGWILNAADLATAKRLGIPGL
jgi:hypothetical protein